MYSRFLPGVVTIILGTLVLAASAYAQAARELEGQHDNHTTTESGPHGGTVQTIGPHRIETVVVRKGVMFRLLDADGRPIAAPRASGSLSLRLGENNKPYTYELKPLKNDAIGVGIDLSKVVGQMLHMNVTLNGISQEPLSFHAMGKISDRALSDTVLMSLQETCPVSGKKLGSMGTPPKVVVEGKLLFVCCGGCSAKIRSSPAQYIAKYYASSGEQVRPGVFKATLADAQAIAAQGVCPVMDEPLGSMGAPLKVDVNGKAIYICCAGCAKKLHAQPETFLAKLRDMGVEPPAMN